MKSKLITEAFAGALCMLMAMPAAAQVNDEAAWRDFARQLGPGAFVKVRLETGQSITGHVIGTDDAYVRISPKTRIAVPIRSVAYGEIVSMERRNEPKWNPGTKVLLGVGIAVGALY